MLTEFDIEAIAFEVSPVVFGNLDDRTRHKLALRDAGVRGIQLAQAMRKYDESVNTKRDAE